MSRDRSFRRVLDVALPLTKLTASVLALVIAIKLQIDSDFFFDGHDHGARAALFALGGAVALFYELIPNGREQFLSRIAPWSTRITGATLASFAAWSWILDETNSDPLSLMQPVAGIGVFAIVVPLLVLLSCLANLHDNKGGAARNEGRDRAEMTAGRLSICHRPWRTGGSARNTGEVEGASSSGLWPPDEGWL